MPVENPPITRKIPTYSPHFEKKFSTRGENTKGETQGSHTRDYTL